jgi:uncharacterized protein DUF6379
MFDKYIICDDEVRNLVEKDRTTGFQFGARLPYYRGLGLSMVEDIRVTLDGESIPSKDISLILRGRRWSIAELETEYEERWEMGEIATIQIAHPGGLTPGRHRLDVQQQLRISYLPFPLIGQDSKTVAAS